MRQETKVAIVRKKTYMMRVLRDCLHDGRNRQNRAHGAGPQQQHSWKETTTRFNTAQLKLYYAPDQFIYLFIYQSQDTNNVPDYF